MNITATQIEELNSLKSSILIIEKNIVNAKTEMELAMDIEDTSIISKLQSAIEFGCTEIDTKISMQAKSMKISFNLCLGLLFDREYTLSKIQ